jgi:hypothetical protein
MGIPVYVIIDRGRDTVRVLSDPSGSRYQVETASPFGKPFTLPEPVSLTIDTTSFPAIPED